MATLVLLESLATVIIPQLIYYMQEGNFIFCCLSRRHSFVTMVCFHLSFKILVGKGSPVGPGAVLAERHGLCVIVVSRTPEMFVAFTAIIAPSILDEFIDTDEYA